MVSVPMASADGSHIDEGPLISQGPSAVRTLSSLTFNLVTGRIWQGATTGLRAHRDPLTKRHFCAPFCIPLGAATLHPPRKHSRSMPLPLSGSSCELVEGREHFIASPDLSSAFVVRGRENPRFKKRLQGRVHIAGGDA